LARYLVLGTLPILPWFALLSALISVVLIRIVIITATSYNLSHYAMEMMIRVLVLELIPLTAALFVALRNTVPGGTELARMQARGDFQTLQQAGVDPLRAEVLPRVVAGIFAVLMLASVSCLIAMVLAYVAVYGFSLSAFAGFTRTMGHIFNPAVALIFALKTLFFSFAVALIPVSTVFSTRRLGGPSANRELRGLLRLFATLLAIEIISLLSNYY
jgi:phospholipid/cholesterol/gamma-HCH transport system permease protein